MNNYDKIFQGNGHLTDEGKQIMNAKFLPVVQELLASMETDNQIRIMAGMLSNLAGKSAADLIMSRKGQSSSSPTIETKIAEWVDPFENMIANARASEDFQKISAKVQETLQPIYDEAEKLSKKIQENRALIGKNIEDWVEEQFAIKPTDKPATQPKEDENKHT